MCSCSLCTLCEAWYTFLAVVMASTSFGSLPALFSGDASSSLQSFDNSAASNACTAGMTGKLRQAWRKLAARWERSLPGGVQTKRDDRLRASFA